MPDTSLTSITATFKKPSWRFLSVAHLKIWNWNKNALEIIKYKNFRRTIRVSLVQLLLIRNSSLWSHKMKSTWSRHDNRNYHRMFWQFWSEGLKKHVVGPSLPLIIFVLVFQILLKLSIRGERKMVRGDRFIDQVCKEK